MKSFLISFLLFCPFLPNLTYSQTWQDVGGGTNNSSHGMCLYDDKLVNAGSFNNPCQKVATWNGTDWECLGGGVGVVGRDAIEWNGNLVVVGDFWNVFLPCTDCHGIAMWDGTAWTNLGTGFNNDVLCLAIWNGDLIAGGDFTEADGQPCSRIARWDGTTWQPIGGPTDFDNDIRCMVEFEDELWVGGDFNNVAGCTACDGLVKWNGTNWVGGDSGVDIQGGVDSTVRVLYVNPNDGNLYMGGHFTDLSIDGVTTAFNGVAMYDGSDWTPLGSGVNSYVRAIHEYNGNLIVGGDFTAASGTPASKIAKWNPNTSTWYAMGAGMNDYVKSAAVYNGVFYAGGAFTQADGMPRDYIASWYEVPSVAPVASISSSTSTICAGGCVSFSDLSTNSPTTWSWSFPGATVTSSNVQNPGSICYSAPGTYTITLEACNGSGCDQTTSTITVSGTPTVSFSGGTICEGSTLILTAIPSATGGTYLWSPGGSTTQSVTVSPTSTTTYSVTYSLNGCSSDAFSQTIMVNNTPDLSVSSPITICSGADVVLTANSTAAGGAFSWSPGGESTQSINVSPTSTTVYTVSYTLGGCNAIPATTTVNVNPTPSITVNNATICAGSSVSLTANPSLSGGSYLWTPGGATSPTLTVSPPTSTSFTVTYSLAGCQSAPATAAIDVVPQPSISLDDYTVCNGSSIDITANPSALGGTYSWSPGGASGQTISISPTSNITYTVTYSVLGCADVSDDGVITVLESPTVAVNDETICAGENTTLTASPSISGGNFDWLPDGETTNSIIVSPTSTTNYTINYTAPNGCTASDFAQVIVNPIPDNEVIISGNTLTAVQVDATYQWLRCPSMDEIPGAISESFTPDANGSYAVQISLNGCTSSSDCEVVNWLGATEGGSVLVSVYPNPANSVVFITVSDELIGKFIELRDIEGRLIITAPIDQPTLYFDLNLATAGVYTLHVTGESGVVRLVKL